MATLVQKIERLLFGATAEERVAAINKLVDQKVVEALDRAFADLDADADADAFAAEDDGGTTEPRKDGGDAA